MPLLWLGWGGGYLDIGYMLHIIHISIYPYTFKVMLGTPSLKGSYKDDTSLLQIQALFTWGRTSEIYCILFIWMLELWDLGIVTRQPSMSLIRNCDINISLIRLLWLYAVCTDGRVVGIWRHCDTSLIRYLLLCACCVEERADGLWCHCDTNTSLIRWLCLYAGCAEERAAGVWVLCYRL